MIPLIKNGRMSKKCSNNYRSLTIGTRLSKLIKAKIIKLNLVIFVIGSRNIFLFKLLNYQIIRTEKSGKKARSTIMKLQICRTTGPLNLIEEMRH